MDSSRGKQRVNLHGMILLALKALDLVVCGRWPATESLWEIGEHVPYALYCSGNVWQGPAACGSFHCGPTWLHGRQWTTSLGCACASSMCGFSRDTDGAMLRDSWQAHSVVHATCRGFRCT